MYLFNKTHQAGFNVQIQDSILQMKDGQYSLIISSCTSTKSCFWVSRWGFSFWLHAVLNSVCSFFFLLDCQPPPAYTFTCIFQKTTTFISSFRDTLREHRHEASDLQQLIQVENKTYGGRCARFCFSKRNLLKKNLQHLVITTIIEAKSRKVSIMFKPTSHPW